MGVLMCEMIVCHSCMLCQNNFIKTIFFAINAYVQIKKLIWKFIGKQETINLVVVPCNVDIATTEALKMAQEVDPEGERTLGK